MNQAVKFDVKYEGGHSYVEEWQKSAYHCPRCGQKEVWHETGPGDYYVGEKFICLACDAHFYLPDDPVQCYDWQSKQRREALWKHIKEA
jgi:transposase-like protein